MRLYLAGPVFTSAERSFNSQLKAALEKAGHEVWLPQEKLPRELNAAEIFHMNVDGIMWADVVVANMDGSDPDSGACWECGYAYGKKPIVVFRTDIRTGEDPTIAPYNLMLTESANIHLEVPWKAVSEVAERVNEALITVSHI
jgi:nucleoside 2-deoxyribosyltransferase